MSYVAEQFEPVLKRRGGQLSPDQMRQRKEAARRRRHKVGRAGLTAAKVLVPVGLAVAGAHQQRKQHARLLDSMRRSNETSEALLNATRDRVGETQDAIRRGQAHGQTFVVDSQGGAQRRSAGGHSPRGNRPMDFEVDSHGQAQRRKHARS